MQEKEELEGFLYSSISAGEHGTPYQLKNLLHHTNVVAKPGAMHVMIFVSCLSHILTTAMRMESLSDVPCENMILDTQNV